MRPAKSNLLTAKETAQILGVSPASLAVWRCKSRYIDVLPHFTRLGRVYYRKADVERFKRWLHNA